MTPATAIVGLDELLPFARWGQGWRRFSFGFCEGCADWHWVRVPLVDPPEWSDHPPLLHPPRRQGSLEWIQQSARFCSQCGGDGLLYLGADSGDLESDADILCGACLHELTLRHHGIPVRRPKLERRNVRMIKLAEEGWTVEKLAAEFGLGKSQVRKIITGFRTDRNTEILELRRGGLGPAEIAEKIGISRSTVQRELRKAA